MVQLYCNWNSKNIHEVAEILAENKDLPYMPMEIWFCIEKQIRIGDKQKADTYYRGYFSPEHYLLQLRYETRSGKKYYYDNTAKYFHEDFINIIRLFDEMKPMTYTCENIRILYQNINTFTKLVFKWYFWIYDHQYEQQYYDFKTTLVDKIYIFYRQLRDKLDNMTQVLCDERVSKLKQSLTIIGDCIYFIETYHPFKLNFQLNDYKYLDKYYPSTTIGSNYHDNIIQTAYEQHRLHNQMQQYKHIHHIYEEIEEFECYLYDNAYYNHHILENTGMKLRSGKRLVSLVKTPQYFWKNNVIYRIYN